MGDIVRGNKLINAIHSIIHVTVCKMCYCNMCYWWETRSKGMVPLPAESLAGLVICYLVHFVLVQPRKT